ncbi:MAG: alcohol dehydrogenase catalytic domain-containing protein [Phycisphaerae bacterium]|nr:alcohol dehydrogenase catalytic domain-containing protein [Phycisphaerae bacterium]
MLGLVYDGKLAVRRNLPQPDPPKGEALIQVALAGICSTDLEITKGYMGFTGVLGHEFVGTVVRGSRRWEGRRVVGEINCVCERCDMCRSGMSNHCRHRTVLGIAGRDGCFAEMIALPERNLHEVPETVGDEEAVFVEPLAAAFQVVKQVRIEPRMRVAVLGSGRLGLLVAQVLARTGCRLHVVGRNEKTLSFCDKKGIQTVLVDDLVPKKDYDVAVECTGAPAGFELASQLVRPRGQIVLKSTYAAESRINLTPLVVDEIELLGSRCGPFPDALSALARKEIDVLSMISRALPLSRAIEAMEIAADPQNLKVLLKIPG